MQLRVDALVVVVVGARVEDADGSVVVLDEEVVVDEVEVVVVTTVA